MSEPLIDPPAPGTRVTEPPPPPPQQPGPPVEPRPPKRIGTFGRGVWLVIGTVMAIGAIGWGGVNAVGLIAHEEWDEGATFAADDLSAVEIVTADGRVDVRGADVDEVQVEMRVSRGLRRTGVSDEVRDGVLRLHSTCPIMFGEWCSVDYDVVVPRGLALTIDTGNGGVHVAEFEGMLVVDADHGSVELVEVAGDVTASTDHGSVTGSDLAGDVDVDTDHGSVDLSFVTAPEQVVASTDHGSVTLALPDVDDGYDVRVDGDDDAEIDVVDDPRSTRLVNVDTDHGSITVRDRG